MNKIRIHRYENPLWGRYHLPFFKKFDTYLKQFFEVELITYKTDNSIPVGPIDIIKALEFEIPPIIADTENVLENTQTGELKVISVAEVYANYVSNFANSHLCSSVLLSHFNYHNLYFWVNNNMSALSKIKPWIFLPFAEFDVEHYRQLRTNCRVFNNKMFWKGSYATSLRKTILELYNFGDMQNIEPTNNLIDYLDLLYQSKIAVSFYLTLSKYRTPFDYIGEFCYRDIEYQLLGVPYIRIEYKDTLHNPLLPNQHYISIPREDAAVAFERCGDIGVAELYQLKYLDVIQDTNFLDYISKNQIKWSNENLLNGNAEKLTFDLLQLKDWLN